MFYYLIITLGAGGCRKLLSFVGRRGVTKKLGGERERERERGTDAVESLLAPIIHTLPTVSTTESPENEFHNVNIEQYNRKSIFRKPNLYSRHLTDDSQHRYLTYEVLPKIFCGRKIFPEFHISTVEIQKTNLDNLRMRRESRHRKSPMTELA
jgi:hypothetical protein